MSGELDLLARKYNTDKRTNDIGETMFHGYTPIYESLLDTNILKYKSILEIGVATGASHEMWYDYFPNAIIYGIDNFVQYENPNIDNDRINIFQGDQTDAYFLETTFKDMKFDLIIDDGGHGSWQHQISFKYLFPKLNNKCYYIIEDLAICLERGYRQYDDMRSSTIEWLKSMQTDNPFSYYMTPEESFLFLSQIDSIDFIDQLGVILKK